MRPILGRSSAPCTSLHLCIGDHFVDVVRREPSLLGLDLGAGLGLRDLIVRAYVEDPSLLFASTWVRSPS